MRALLSFLLALATAFARPSYAAADLRFAAMEPGDQIIVKLTSSICYYTHSKTTTYVLSFTKPVQKIIVSAQDASHPRPQKLGELALSSADVANLDKTLLASRAARESKTIPHGEPDISLTFVERGSVLRKESLHSPPKSDARALTFDDILIRLSKKTNQSAGG